MIITRLLAVGTAIVAALGIAAVSRARIPVHTSNDAVLRLAFSARPERIEHCRTLSDAELADVPQHMRQREVCEGTTASYRLEARRNDVMLESRVVRGGGMRSDRQLYVFDEFPLPSGTSVVEVRLERIDVRDMPDSLASAAELRDTQDSLATREQDARARRVADAVPAQLLLRETVTLEPREVLLVTFDRETRQLRLQRAP